jgi:hypothetical protein
MKYIYVAILFIHTLLFAGCVTQKNDGVKDLLKESDLTSEQFREWSQIRDKWLKNSFRPCLSESHLELSCAHCTSVYCTLILHIDENGNVSHWKKTKSRACGSEAPDALIRCFVRFLENVQFSKEFRGRSFEVMFGTGLKC